VVISGRPVRPVDVPWSVLGLAGGRPITPVWVNELGGTTFEVGQGPDRCFVKWSPAGSGLPGLAGEVARLRWAAPFTPVRVVLAHDHDDQGEWLVTRPLAGENAVEPRWVADPATAVRAIGEGLRALHESLPVAACPFSWSVQDRVTSAFNRAPQLDPARWHAVHQGLGVPAALDIIGRPPPTDRLVVCHGDSCAPNTLLGPDGRWTGHVDLGALGVADRWADLAVATWSTEWNYGPGWTEPLLAAYGIVPDPPRIAYYRLLWDLGP
jgi:kanamycin kinase